MSENEQAKAKYEAECKSTEVIATKAIISYVDQGNAIHFEQWKASRERMKLSDEQMQ